MDFWGFQPSVHSETASSAIFYLWVWKMTFVIFENPGILSTPGWLYTHIVCIYKYIHNIHIYRKRERISRKYTEPLLVCSRGGL